VKAPSDWYTCALCQVSYRERITIITKNWASSVFKISQNNAHEAFVLTNGEILLRKYFDIPEKKHVAILSKID
jgi:hypothetical protein